MASDYRDTLNLPKTDFPMKADLANKEPIIQKRWEETLLYQKMLSKDAPRGNFILHDGPPYTNSLIHMGTAMNKVLKDFVIKLKTMQGFRTPYVPGFDNHGMPIENEVSKQLREKGKSFDKKILRKACRSHAEKFIQAQTKQFQRLGVLGAWDRPYKTMGFEYEANIVRAFGKLNENGYIYRGLKPVLWCPFDETALADAEVEYAEHISDSIFVRFPLLDDPKGVFEGCDFSKSYVVIWTTTPWTVPANLAVAASPEFEYALVKSSDGFTMLILKDLVSKVMEKCSIEEYEIIKSIKGLELTGLVFKHPIFDRPSPLLLAEHDHKGQPFVSAADGTGVVHIAPGHGEADFHLGAANGLEVLNPVDTKGFFTDKAGEQFSGLDAKKEGGEKVLETLRAVKNLLGHEKYAHSYPHCWRCGSALMFRATVQWFMNIDHEDHRERCIRDIHDTRWFPEQGRNRIESMVRNRPDWCLSRQRAWGVGIPAFYCVGCDEPLITIESIEAVAKLVSESGSDSWFTTPAEEILPSGTKCPGCGKSEFRKEQDVLDVWFDSGSSNFAVLNSGVWPELSWPADLYFEGTDQHRGWFNTSLMIGEAIKGRAPYRNVVTHGFVLDEKRFKMSKSKGNVLEPVEICNKFGADIFRLWCASINYFEDVAVSESILQNISVMYRDIRNCLRFLLSNLYDFKPSDAVTKDEMQEIDRWILAKLQIVIEDATAAYEVYEFSHVTQAVTGFIATELSPIYMDVIKDRLYSEAPSSAGRRSAQTAMMELARVLIGIMAPILPHSMDEAFTHFSNSTESILLENFPVVNSTYKNDDLVMNWESLLDLRNSVSPSLEQWRQSFKDESVSVKAKSLDEAAAKIKLPQKMFELMLDRKELICSLLKVSSVELVQSNDSTVHVEVTLAPGKKCARCWIVKEDVGKSSEYPDICVKCSEVMLAIK